jgi:hypothetical protein
MNNDKTGVKWYWLARRDNASASNVIKQHQIKRRKTNECDMGIDGLGKSGKTTIFNGRPGKAATGGYSAKAQANLGMASVRITASINWPNFESQKIVHAEVK